MLDNHTWIGGLVPALSFRKDGRFRPTLAMWMTPSGDSVAMRLCHPDEAADTLRLLLAESLRSRGRKSRPTCIRVFDEGLVQGLGGLDGPPPGVVAPDGFFDVVAHDHMGMMPELGRPETYLEGDVTIEAVSAYFEGMRRLERAGLLVEGEPMLVQVDVPSLGVERACVWLGEEVLIARGFIVFRSLEQYEDFMRVQVQYTHMWADDDDRSVLVGSFEGQRWLPPAMRREIRKHRWPVHRPALVPRFDPHDPSGVRRPACNTDVELAAVVSTGLAEAVGGPAARPSLASPTTKTLEVTIGPRSHTITVTAPHPEASEEQVALGVCPEL
jgi:hypothetical protein